MECVKHNGLVEDEGQETVCHQDLPICASLISAPVSARIDRNAGRRERGQGHHAQANQSGQCSRDSSGLLPRNVPGCFFFLVNLRETPNRAV